MSEEASAAVEATVREIRRKTRKKYSAEEKVRIVLEAFGGRKRLQSCVVEKASTRICTTSGAKSSLRRAMIGGRYKTPR